MSAENTTTNKNANVYIARQPIFDTQKRVVAYEMLYRDNDKNIYTGGVDGEKATQTVVAHTLINIGMDTLCGNKKMFVNMTEGHLLADTALMLPPERAVIEILEHVLPTDAVIAACQRLKEEGYILALDDFIFQPEMEAFFPHIDIIKFDFHDIDLRELHKQLLPYREKYTFQLLAEKIETYDEYHLAKENGFTLFQGYFFCKPEMVKRKGFDSSNVHILELLSEINKKNCSLPKVEKMLEGDVGLSYKLLRYINSAGYSLVNKVTTVKRAMAFLGTAGVRQFVNLVAVSQLSENKPSALLRLSMNRAQLCKILGEKSSQDIDPAELFLLGLFSLLDAILDTSMDEVVRALPLTEDLKLGLIGEEGPLGKFLSVVKSHEQADFDQCSLYLHELGLTPQEMTKSYQEAVIWAEQDEESEEGSDTNE